MNDFTATRAAEARRVTVGAALVCGLGCLAALVPAVEHTTNFVVGGIVGLVLVVLVVRLLVRLLRERREDRADALTAARWRAVHAPHLLTPADRAHLDAIGYPFTPPVSATAQEVA